MTKQLPPTIERIGPRTWICRRANCGVQLTSRKAIDLHVCPVRVTERVDGKTLAAGTDKD